MRKIFVDLGCGNCEDLLNFWGKNKDYIYYGIDPSHNYHHKWIELEKKYLIIFINEAAWIKDGEIIFYDEQLVNPQGSTLIKEKKGIGNMEVIRVKGFDFSEWLKQFKDDYVILFMDIEGAEYDILNKMFEDGTISIPKKIFYEGHAHKIYNDRIKELCVKVEKKLEKIRHWKIGSDEVIDTEYFGEGKNENN